MKLVPKYILYPVLPFCTSTQSLNLSQNKDPFYELPETEVIVGVASVPLNYLSHMLDFEESLSVIDYMAKQCGYLKVALVPCDSSGREEVDLCVENPMDLVRIQPNLDQGPVSSKYFAV